MPVLISGFFVLIVWGYVLFISRWHLFWNASFTLPLKLFMQGRVALTHSIVIGIALLALVISIVTMFRVREQSMVVGSKKTLFLFAVLLLIAMMILVLKIAKIEVPVIKEYLARAHG